MALPDGWDAGQSRRYRLFVEPMHDPGAAERELLSDTWRGVVRGHLESRGWWQHVSGFSSLPPHLYLHPGAPEEIEGTLTDLIAQGLVVERAIMTLEWL